MKHEEDIIQELGRLPNTLKESYDIIYQRIQDSGLISRAVAERAMKWLLCALRPLQSPEFIAAISADADGQCLKLSNIELLDMCCNMVVLDVELDVFRFAHLSVREYLESREGYTKIETHTTALERCIDILVSEPRSLSELKLEQDSIFRPYAILYWPIHCQSVGSDQLTCKNKDKVRRFLLQGCDAAPSFKKWISAAEELSRSLQWDDPLQHQLRAAASSPLTPLFLACTFGLLWILDHLISERFDWTQTNRERQLGMHLAARWGHEAVVRLLVEQGADVEARDEDGQTALHRAARYGHEAVVRLLVEQGADVEARDEVGWTALHWAARYGHEVVVRLLVERGVDVGARDEDGWTALHSAADNGHEAVVRLLVEQGVDVEARDEVGWTALHRAARHGHEALVQLLQSAAQS
jgi:ankyrin repeat protein